MKKIVGVYPWPMPPKLAEALQAIDGINPVEALPGGPGPVLAIRKAPPFVCDAILVSSPERVADAVRIITADGIELVSAGDILGRMMGGAEVTELPPEKVESRVRFR